MITRAVALHRVAILVAVTSAVGCRKEEPQAVQADPQARPLASASHAPIASVPLDLPKSLDDEAPAFVIVIGASGLLLIDGVEVKDDAKIEALARAATAKDPDVRAIVSAAREANYGRVIDVIDRMKRGGITKISFAVIPKAP